MNTNDLMAEVTVEGRLRDGGKCTIKANRINADNLHLEDGLFHPFEREDGSKILYMLEDGEGTSLMSDGDNKGVSLPALVVGRKNMVGYISDDVFDVRQSNLITTKQKNTFR